MGYKRREGNSFSQPACAAGGGLTSPLAFPSRLCKRVCTVAVFYKKTKRPLCVCACVSPSPQGRGLQRGKG